MELVQDSHQRFDPEEVPPEAGNGTQVKTDPLAEQSNVAGEELMADRV